MLSNMLSLFLVLLISLVFSDCPDGKEPFILVRTTRGYAFEESLSIYFGTDTSVTPVYEEARNSVGNNMVYNHDLCLSPGLHTVVLGDGFGDGWATGSKVQILQGETEIASITWTCATIQGFSCTTTFTATEQPAWQYTSDAQTSSDWRTANITWPSASSGFSAPTTTTRYFRRTIPLEGEDKVGILVSVQTDAGAVVYVNGVELIRWYMPDGDVTSDTQATTSGNPVTHRFNQILGALPSPIDGGYIIAVEIHSGSVLPTTESFSCSVGFFSEDFRLIDSDGSYTCTPESVSESDNGAKLYDDNVITKWCAPITSEILPSIHIWTFGNGDRRIMNKYALSTAYDMPARDCVSWTIAGSNDGSIWDTLDTQTGVVWTDRRQTKSFNLTNSAAYNKYRWSCSQVYDLSSSSLGGYVQMSEWNLLMAGSAYAVPGFSYPQSSYSWSVDMDTVNISVGKTGYTNWQIVGAGGATLPNGLNFNSANGDITGTPTESIEHTTFTVSATYSSDNKVYNTTITITVIGCELPFFIPITVDKTNYNAPSESWTIKNSDGETVLSSDPTTSSVGACVAVGDYTVTMTSSAGAAWVSSSLMTISALADTHSFVLSRARLTIQGEDSFTLSIQLPLLPLESESFKYLADGTVPSDWYGANFNDDGWNSLNSTGRPSTSQKVKLFRASFDVVTKQGAHGFELHLNACNGVVAYLNGNEVYRVFLENGDITSDTVPTGDSNTYAWRRVTGPISNINTGANTIAVAVLTSGSEEASIDFDMHLRLLMNSHNQPRFWDYSTSGTTASQSVFLFDQNPSTDAYVSKATVPEQSFVIQFNNNGAEFFNKYCFVTNENNQRYDPREWVIQGSMDGQSYTTLKEESNAYFDSRSTSYCYYMPGNTKAWTYYQLTLKKSRVDDTDSYYSLADWNLYLEDLTMMEIPDLSFSPNELAGYTGEAMPSATCSSSYYSTFSIQPPLPSELSFSTSTGLITGTPSTVIPTTTYTISALTPSGETKTTTISITVSECSGDKIAFTIQLIFETGASGCSFQLKDRSTGMVVEELGNFTDSSTLSIPMCRAATTYSLVLKKTDTTGWGSNKANVLLADGRILLSESLAAGLTEKEYDFNPAYAVLPQWNQWHYLTDDTSTVPSNWYTMDGAPSNWSTAQTASLPVSDAVTQYYYTKFSISDLNDYASMDIAVKVKAGVIVYLNGEEIRRYNLPEDQEITSATTATAESGEPFWLITGEAVQSKRLVVGENIIAFELHRYGEKEENNSFDASAILILDGMYMLLEGEGSTTPSQPGLEGSDKLFDNNSDTKMLTATSICEGVEIEWKWNDQRREPIARYGLVSGNDCNNRHPSGWTLSGSNDGDNWRVLQTKTGQYFTAYKQQKLFNLFNVIPYNRYRLVVTECGNEEHSTNCDDWGKTKRFQLADFYLFTRLTPDEEYCPPEGDFEGAMNGDTSFADCPKLYEGTRSRTCVNGTLSNEVIACHPLIPESVNYEQNQYTLTRGKGITIPATVVGAEITCSAFPTLPSGLKLDPATCVISGTPKNVQESQRYVITVTNKGGSIQTVMHIDVADAPINWIMIGIITGVVVILFLIIIIIVVSTSKKEKKSKKLPKNNKPKKPAQLKKKTSVVV